MIRHFFIAILVFSTLPVHAAKWIELKTPNFTVIADTSAGKAKKFVTQLEEFNAYLKIISNVQEEKVITPLTVYLVSSRQKYIKLTGSKTTAGVYFKSRFGPVAVAVAERKQWDYGMDPIETIFHEYVHYFMRQYGVDNFPYWYSEGMAEYYSTFKKKKKYFELGRIPRNRVPVLAATRKWAPASSILASKTSGSGRVRWGDETSLFYAQSWMITYFLHQDKKLLKNLAVYQQKLMKGESPVLAFEPTFGVPISYLDAKMAELRKTRQTYLYRLPLKKLKTHKPVVRKLSAMAGNKAEYSITGYFTPMVGSVEKPMINLRKRTLKKVADLLASHEDDVDLNLLYTQLAMRSLQPDLVSERLAYLGKRVENQPTLKNALAVTELSLLAGDGKVVYSFTNQQKAVLKKYKSNILSMLKQDKLNVHLRYLYSLILAHKNSPSLKSAEVILYDTYVLYPQNTQINMLLFNVLLRQGKKQTACYFIRPHFNAERRKKNQNYISYRLTGQNQTYLSCAFMQDKA